MVLDYIYILGGSSKSLFSQFCKTIPTCVQEESSSIESLHLDKYSSLNLLGCLTC
jgi:hypothetical protein